MIKDGKGYCAIHVRVPEDIARQIEELRSSTGLSVREIIGYSSKPCSCCKNVDIVAYNSKDKTIKIPRGILFQSLLKKHSTHAKSNKSGKGDQ